MVHWVGDLRGRVASFVFRGRTEGESGSPFAFPAGPEIAEIEAEIGAISGGRKSVENAAGRLEIALSHSGTRGDRALAEIEGRAVCCCV